MELVSQVIKEIGLLFYEISWLLLFGFIVSALIRLYFTPYIQKFKLDSASVKNVFLSSLIGVPMPLCSCSVVPVALSLKKSGLSRSSVLSFIASTPHTGVDSFWVTSQLLSWPFAIFKIVVSLLSGFLVGIIDLKFLKKEKIDKKKLLFQDTAQSKELSFFKNVFSYLTEDLVPALRFWIILSVVISALISVLVPSDIYLELFEKKLGLLGSYSLIFVISLLLYVCSISSLPIALVLIQKGFPEGAVLIFLLAGPASNLGSLTLMWNLIGKYSTIIYVSVISLVSIVFALIIDIFQLNLINEKSFINHHLHEMNTMPWDYKSISVIIFLGLIMWSYLSQFAKKAPVEKNNKFTLSKKIKITNLHCQNCIKKSRQIIDQYEDSLLVDNFDTSGNTSIHYENNEILTDFTLEMKQSGFELK